MVNTKLEQMNLLDKFLFDEAMEDSKTYEAVVSILLENEVKILEKPETLLTQKGLMIRNFHSKTDQEI